MKRMLLGLLLIPFLCWSAYGQDIGFRGTTYPSCSDAQVAAGTSGCTPDNAQLGNLPRIRTTSPAATTPVGTVSTSGSSVTLTLSSVTDWANIRLGTSIITASGVRHVKSKTAPNILTVYNVITLGAGTAFTYLYPYQADYDSSSNLQHFISYALNTAGHSSTVEVWQDADGNVQKYKDANGNVGIGTTGPNGLLHLGQTSSDLTHPTLAFGVDGNTGFYEDTVYADNLIISINGIAEYRVNSQGFRGAGVGEFQLKPVSPSATTPNILSSADDSDTGIGNAGANILSLIAGGVNGLNVNAGNVGIGTTMGGGTNPAMAGKLNVFGGYASVWDASTIANESLTNGALTSGTSWTQTNDCALASDKATWTYNAGTASTLTQASATLAIPTVPNRWYKLVYTVSGITGTPSASVTTAWASASTALTLTAGTQTTYVKSAASPGNFVITSTLTTGQAFSLDDISLKEVLAGDLSIGGGLVLGPRVIPPGTTGDQTMNRAAGRVNAAIGSTSLTVTNSLCTANSIVFATSASADATGYVTSVVPGAGSFVINYLAPTAEMPINWMLVR